MSELDGVHLFCGKDRDGDSQYCAEHHSKAVQEPYRKAKGKTK